MHFVHSEPWSGFPFPPAVAVLAIFVKSFGKDPRASHLFSLYVLIGSSAECFPAN